MLIFIVNVDPCLDLLLYLERWALDIILLEALETYLDCNTVLKAEPFLKECLVVPGLREEKVMFFVPRLLYFVVTGRTSTILLVLAALVFGLVTSICLNIFAKFEVPCCFNKRCPLPKFLGFG